uniref:Uncharacterized protein n=1 Tax=Mimiviridae sp. ChoanoV1 TaxID=2596887 RepID=A0A5B8HY81_9VIRU|nr:hypothetical protein 5_7 [Mimiviridae sp. ChoanoV1]
MEDNITVLVDAKIEYTKQLTNILVPYIFEGIKSIYETSKGVCKLNNDSNVLMRFQEQLSQIPKWNQEIIDDEYNRIIDNSGCDWLDELVTAVFLSHTKILTSIKSSKKKNKINLKIPKIDHFIHKCYIESAREIWKNPYLFSDNYNQCDYQRNLRDCNNIINDSIQETIRKLLPVKNILKEYLGENDEESNFVPEQYRDNLRKLVKKELELVKRDESNNDESLDTISSNDINIENNDLLKIVDVESGKNQKKLEVENIKELATTELNKELETTELNKELETTELHKELETTELHKELETTELPKELETTELNKELETTKLHKELETTELNKELETTELNKELETTELNKELETTELNKELETTELLKELETTELLKELETTELQKKLETTELNKELEPTELKNEEIKNNTDEGSLNLEINEINLENDMNSKKCEKNKEEIKDINLINNIINNDLYNKNLDNDSSVSDTEELDLNDIEGLEGDSELNEIKLDNLNFKKININDMNVESLDLDDLNLEQNVETEDIEVQKPVEEDSNIKKIVIDDDRNNLKKFTKDKKSFRFFD